MNDAGVLAIISLIKFGTWSIDASGVNKSTIKVMVAKN